MSPDHVSSTAQTLTSTKPSGSATTRTTSSVISVGTPADFFGHDTQTVACGSSDLRYAASAFDSSGRLVLNRCTMSVDRLTLEANRTAGGRGSSSAR